MRSRRSFHDFLHIRNYNCIFVGAWIFFLPKFSQTDYSEWIKKPRTWIIKICLCTHNIQWMFTRGLTLKLLDKRNIKTSVSKNIPRTLYTNYYNNNSTPFQRFARTLSCVYNMTICRIIYNTCCTACTAHSTLVGLRIVITNNYNIVVTFDCGLISDLPFKLTFRIIIAVIRYMTYLWYRWTRVLNILICKTLLSTFF